jgi:hypothetical protein
MIENERQYHITREAVEKFDKAIINFNCEPVDPTINPRIARAQREALVSQRDELKAQMRDYEREKGKTIH